MSIEGSELCLSLKWGSNSRKTGVYTGIVLSRTSAPSVKVNSIYIKDKVWPLVLLIVFFTNPMSVRCSTNWDRKGWPGSDRIQMYGCLWLKSRRSWKSSIFIVLTLIRMRKIAVWKLENKIIVVIIIVLKHFFRKWIFANYLFSIS